MKTKKVLIVDDCRMTVLLLRYILEGEGIAVDTASTGVEALEKLRRRAYCLVFLDIDLPGVDGIEVARTIRKGGLEPAPEIFLMTGMGEEFEPSMVDAAGATGVFFKPMAPSRIIETARDVLRTPEQVS